MRAGSRSTIHMSVRAPNGRDEEGARSLRSLKHRMTHATDPSERVMSSSPTGSWLEGLRGSFEPESTAKQKPAQKQKGGLIAGRLRSV